VYREDCLADALPQLLSPAMYLLYCPLSCSDLVVSFFSSSQMRPARPTNHPWAECRRGIDKCKEGYPLAPAPNPYVRSYVLYVYKKGTSYLSLFP
jgi:hypothetical protein